VSGGFGEGDGVAEVFEFFACGAAACTHSTSSAVSMSQSSACGCMPGICFTLKSTHAVPEATLSQVGVSPNRLLKALSSASISGWS
jgi:hypothetical protein